MLIKCHQVIFEGCFQNTNEGHMVTHLFDNIGHRLWFQDPLNHFGSELHASYIARIFCKIFDFLHI